ncbi:uncharacterized protein Dwil_GK16684 [Drosophila willistoni]|uniref:HTH CENPB-type domain-containing protein n=1 Tax=Drosophila willistoni TaxID=7260 RepID=B4MLB9_DROWI|nr:uncharacterized protein Dwil_GK16684 [Drosophila willistoni]
MRVREKRKQQKEPKAPQSNHKDDDKNPKLSADADARPTASTATTPPSPPAATPSANATATTTTPTTTTTASASATSTLPAAEKVAFDNRIKRKNVLALNEKVAALREYDRLPVYKHVGRLFNCSPDQIKRIVQQREEILRAWEQRTRRSQDARTMETKTVRVSMLGKAVYDWIRRMMYYKDFAITDGLIQKMALQFKSSMGLNHFFPHQEWCDKFRHTYKIPHNYTKVLKIGYTQGYSVQIKDIVKDVMSECTPESTHEDEEDIGEDVSIGSTVSSHVGDDEDAEVDVDGGDISEKEDKDEEKDVKPTLSELNLARAFQSQLPQLVKLPIQANTPPGTYQKVLLATPIVPPAAASAAAVATGAQPMTMTIIPLATLAQSITPRTSGTTAAQSHQQQQQEKCPAIPPPMVDIKLEKEIKTEPKDPGEEAEAAAQTEVPAKPAPAPAPVQPPPPPQQEPVVRIKEEIESDDDELLEDDANGGRSSVNSLAEVLAANVENEKEYIEHMRQRKESPVPGANLPPMPPLTKAPVTVTRQAAKRRHQQPDHDDNNNADLNQRGIAGSGETTVISCTQARKYLKLLEEFALYKENYRLIGLITRADEVMREMGDDLP